jgi:thiol-disulfide isomerase/thioredoxin
MKIITMMVIAVAFMAAGCRATQRTASVPLPQQQAGETGETAEHVWDFRDASTWILGDFDIKRLTEPPYASWYINGYREYQPDQACMEELKETDKSALTITIVLGTWCPDSRREVPRFMKIIDLWGFPEEKIRFIGVDINKFAPLDDYEAMGIERVPTFIFYENNSEKGRIIEVPVSSLEVDSRDILNAEYKH